MKKYCFPVTYSGYKINFVVSCDGNAEEILTRAKKILLCVLQSSASDWSELDQWRDRLPEWFLKEFSNEMTDEEAMAWLEKWKATPPEQQAVAEQNKGWSFSNWIGWFSPSERYWYWWDATIKNASTINVAVLSEENLPPHGALKWLFIACGAVSLDET